MFQMLIFNWLFSCKCVFIKFVPCGTCSPVLFQGLVLMAIFSPVCLFLGKGSVSCLSSSVEPGTFRALSAFGIWWDVLTVPSEEAPASGSSRLLLIAATVARIPQCRGQPSLPCYPEPAPARLGLELSSLFTSECLRICLPPVPIVTVILWHLRVSLPLAYLYPLKPKASSQAP